MIAMITWETANMSASFLKEGRLVRSELESRFRPWGGGWICKVKVLANCICPQLPLKESISACMQSVRRGQNHAVFNIYLSFYNMVSQGIYAGKNSGLPPVRGSAMGNKFLSLLRWSYDEPVEFCLLTSTKGVLITSKFCEYSTPHKLSYFVKDWSFSNYLKK